MIEFDSASREISKCLLTMRTVDRRDQLPIDDIGIDAYDKLYLQCALYVREYNRIAERVEEDDVRYTSDKKRGALFVE
jgi:hypothetical protein